MNALLKTTPIALLLTAAAHAGDYGVSFRYSACTPSYSYSSCYAEYSQPVGYVRCSRSYAPKRYVEYSPSQTVVCDSYVSPSRTVSYGYAPVVGYSTPSTIIYDDRPIYRTTYTRSDCYSNPRSGGRVSIHYGDRSPRLYRSYDSHSRHYRVVKKTRRYHRTPTSSIRISSGHRDSHRRPSITYSPPRRPNSGHYGWSSYDGHGHRGHSRGYTTHRRHSSHRGYSHTRLGSRSPRIRIIRR